MKIEYNHKDDCHDIFFEDAQQSPSIKVYDPDVLKAFEKLEEKDINLFDIASIFNELMEERNNAEAKADEYLADREGLSERVSELESDVSEFESKIEELEAEIAMLKAKVPKPKPILPTEDQVVEMIDRRGRTLDNPGWCISCGEEQDGCEPDAVRYDCQDCGRDSVYAPEELLLRGWYKVAEVQTNLEDKEL